ncbi:PDF receptor-like [Gigantopelta aegis]|uniref:PDF receptor-like n=1 Tax=Gigantopelta aegis TaxID=1735272 RepID=UPI001B88A94D|nr:PDF receptor-like [Gigantopelta aegis]
MDEPKSRQECYEKYRETVSPAFFCDATWDSMLCWPPTMPGMTIRKPCPAVPGFDVTQFAYKSCQKDGQWYRVPTSTREWTNYTNCEVESFTARPKLASSSSREQLFPLMRSVDVVAFVLYSISVIALAVCVVLFCCNTSRRTRRHQVLIPLIVSAMVLSLVSLADLSIREIEKANGLSLSADANVCQAIAFLTRFFQIATSSWIMALSFNYLIPAMKYHFRSGRLLLMYLLGFGLPLVFTPAWLATARYILSKKKFCFSHAVHATHWVADAPMLTCLAVSSCVFAVSAVVVVAVCSRKPRNTSKTFSGRDPSGSLFLKQGCIRGLCLVLYTAAVHTYLAVSSNLDTGIDDAVNTYVEVVVKSTYGLVVAVVLGFLDTEICCCGQEPPEHLIVEGSYRLRSGKF